jgi:hypothetical protein
MLENESKSLTITSKSNQISTMMAICTRVYVGKSGSSKIKKAF